MTIYLNSNKSFENYKELVNEEYFVDKSSMISLLNKKVSTKSKYICVTRPRRFGKSSVADMIAAYYSKAVNSKEVFHNKNISKFTGYIEHINKYNVISISFNEIPDNMRNYKEYINNIIKELRKELIETFNIKDIDDTE